MITRCGTLCYHHRFAHTGAVLQYRFNLTGFNTKTADFDLKIITTQIFNTTVGQPATQITGAIHPRIRLGCKRIGEEAFGSKLGAVQITACHTDTPDIDFTGNTQRYRLLMRIQNIETAIVYRVANRRQARPVSGVAGTLILRHHVGFCRAVLVVQADWAGALAQGADFIAYQQPFASGDDFFYRQSLLRLCAGHGQCLQCGDRQKDALDGVLLDNVQQPVHL